MNCQQCGFSYEDGTKFCSNCGTALNASVKAAERRQLTVVFCDIVGSTGLSESLDPEDLRDLVARYHQACADAVEFHEGHIAQYLGDGVLIYFGYPYAHEDDAHRAIRCGLDILREMRHLNDNEFKQLNASLQIRIGAHTGGVVIGGVGRGAQEEWLALGDTPNLAARVQDLAEPGGLVISDATRRLVEGFFETTPLGERVLKGVSKPVSLFGVTGLSGEATRFDSAARKGLTPFVGRVGEIDAIRADWDLALQGDTRFALIRGEAGIGKSRILEVVKKELAQGGAGIYVAECSPYTRNTALQPIANLLIATFDLSAQVDSEEKLKRLEVMLAALNIDAPEASPIVAELLSIPCADRYPEIQWSPARRRQRLMDWLVEILAGFARDNPALLLFEDLHWADPSTIELITMMMTSTAEFPQLVIQTARPEFSAQHYRGQELLLLDVDRLAPAMVDRMIRHVAGGKALPPEVAVQIAERSEGIPLFIEELTRLVLDSGALVERESIWEAQGDLPSDLIPASLQAMLMTRIDGLGSAKTTAQLAATIGRDFSYSLLSAIHDGDEQTLQTDLRRLVESTLVREVDGQHHGHYSFKHALVHSAAYESQLRSTRQRYHQQIARVLQAESQSEIESQPETIARHLAGAGNHAEATDYWRAAGQRALERSSVREAHGHLQHALEGLAQLTEDPTTLGKELQLQVAIAPTIMAVQGWGAPAVAIACERARALCFKLNALELLYPATWGLWTNQFIGGHLDAAQETATECLEMALASGQPSIEVTGRHTMAYTHYYRGEWEAAMPHVDAAMALYSAAQERELSAAFQLSPTVNLIAARGSGLWMLGHQERGLAEMENMVAVAREVNHPAALSNALGVACYMLTLARQFEPMLRYADEVQSFARDDGYDLWYCVGIMSGGWARLRLGEGAAAVPDLLEGVALFHETFSGMMGTTVAMMHSDGLLALGRPEEALEMLNKTAREAESGKVGVLLPDVYRLIGEIQHSQSAIEDAEIAFKKALETAARQNALSLELRASLSYHELLGETGRGQEGLALIRQRFERFTDSFDQPDLVKAAALLSSAA